MKNIKIVIKRLEKYKRYMKHTFVQEAISQLLNGLAISSDGTRVEETNPNSVWSNLGMIASNIMDHDHIISLKESLSSYTTLNPTTMSNSEQQYIEKIQNRYQNGIRYLWISYDKQGHPKYMRPVSKTRGIKLLNDVEDGLNNPINRDCIAKSVVTE